MTPQEQELISQLFARLKQAPAQEQDRDAAELIRRLAVDQPDAAYRLVQTVLIQEMALNHAQARIAELEKQVVDADVAEPARRGGFLPQRNAGPWGRTEPMPSPQTFVPAQPGLSRPAAAAPGVTGVRSMGAGSMGAGSMGAGPMGAGPMGAGPMGAGPMGTGPTGTGPTAGAGGFMRTAAATAMGVIGGQMLYQGIQSMFGSAAATEKGQPSAGEAPTAPAQPAADSGDPSWDPGADDSDLDIASAEEDWGGDELV